MPFLTDLSVTKLLDGKQRGRALWRIDRPLAYRSLLTGETYVVPIHYETDFASVPRLPLVYLLAGDTAHEAAALHDWLYSSGVVDRKTADTIFQEAMGDTCVPGWRSSLMYGAVRVFGAGHYKAKAQAREKPAVEDPYVG